MYHTPPRRFGAYARYQDVDVAARVEGASPHALVAILFEELLKALDTIAAAERAGDRARVNTAQARALSLLHGLETGLDFERGGEIARSLGLQEVTVKFYLTHLFRKLEVKNRSQAAVLAMRMGYGQQS